MTVTPDGLNVYVASAFGPSGVLAFTRNPLTGELAQLAPPLGCFGPDAWTRRTAPTWPGWTSRVTSPSARMTGTSTCRATAPAAGTPWSRSSATPAAP